MRVFAKKPFMCAILKAALASTAFAALSLVAFAMMLFAPTQAFAEYENPTVTTIAQMQTDNSMRVSSQRAYDFNGQYSLIAVPLTRTTNESEITVESVRLIQLGEDGGIIRNWWTLEEKHFQAAWRDLYNDTEGLTVRVKEEEAKARARSQAGEGASGFFTLPRGDAYSFDKRRNTLYIFLTQTSLNTVVEYNYTISKAALVYEDVAEIYWDYVTPWFDVDSRNINFSLQLPVPEGVEVIPGQTISAWGHGPAGELEIDADGTIDYRVPEVIEGQYAQAHAIFPAKWLTNMPVLEKLSKNGWRRDAALAEELNWEDSYSLGLINKYIFNMCVTGLCVLMIGAALFLYWKRGREDFASLPSENPAQDLKLSESVTNLFMREPAIVRRLLRGNHWSADDFATTICSLENKGIISIAAENDDARFRIKPGAKTKPKTSLDKLTMKILFDEVGEGYQSVSVKDIERACEKRPERMRSVIDDWQRVLDHEVSKEHLFDKRSRKTAKRIAICGAVLGIIGLLGLLDVLLVGDKILSWSLLFSGIAMGVIAYYVPRRTPIGLEISEIAQVKRDEFCGAAAPWELALTAAFRKTLVSAR